MPPRRTDNVETLSPADFATFDVAENYNAAKNAYPAFAAIDAGRQKVLDWVILELTSDHQFDDVQPYCIDLGCARESL
jgi:hypothetical protein